ncbi:hypothetical protein GH714_008746 [Hevea brasiliensis]|uniref:CCHC-type domain-containing protein n=1 Tax=Hevea brasiliensis TaxID=3981 RepID=A0A6A6LZE2_HEVBR|nr:hypothetical protein GH714_008746 [Hevea brasiliensis]
MMQLKFKEGSSIADHLNEFKGTIDHLSSMGIKFDDEILGLLLLNTLPDSWETFRVSLTNSAPNGVVSLEAAEGGVLNEEMRKMSQASSSHAEVLVTENRGRSKSKSHDQNNRSRSRSKSKSRYKNLKCHHCSKTGHIKKYCFKWKKENKADKGKQERKGNDGNNDHVNTTSDDLIAVYHENMVNVASNEVSWVFDSDASFHVSSRKEFFTSYTPGDFGVLKMVNDGMSKVVSTGTVCLETNTGTKLLLKDVRHAPDVRLHLISASKLDDDGYSNMFNDGQLKLTKVESDSSLELWHKRDVSYGHLHVFGCKCFVHVPKDERSKLDAKRRQCIFIGYGQDEFGYRCYDTIEKKLVKNRDVIFAEDYTIEGINKVESSKSEIDGLIDLDPNPTTDMPNAVEVDVQNDTQNNEAKGEHEVIDEVDSPIHEVLEQPEAPLRRSTRDHRASTRIDNLKKELSKSFAIKDLGPEKHILGMKIICDRKCKKLWLSQEKYIQKVLQLFNMAKAKATSFIIYSNRKFICGPIELNFGGHSGDILFFNLGGGDKF